MTYAEPGPALHDVLLVACQSIVSYRFALHAGQQVQLPRCCNWGFPWQWEKAWEVGLGTTANNCSCPRCFVVPLVVETTTAWQGQPVYFPPCLQEPLLFPFLELAGCPSGPYPRDPFPWNVLSFWPAPLLLKVWLSLQ